jgi:hypothetical protein
LGRNRSVAQIAALLAFPSCRKWRQQPALGKAAAGLPQSKVEGFPTLDSIPARPPWSIVNF